MTNRNGPIVRNLTIYVDRAAGSRAIELGKLLIYTDDAVIVPGPSSEVRTWAANSTLVVPPPDTSQKERIVYFDQDGAPQELNYLGLKVHPWA